MHHSLGPEILFKFFGLPIFNTLLTTLFVDAILIALVFAVYKNRKLVPGKLQSVFEMLVEYFYSITEQIAGSRVKYIFPWVASFFIFILASNLVGLLPGVGSVGINHHDDHGENHLVTILRPATSDFNMTFALAIVSLVVTHVFAIKYLGGKGYFTHFFRTDPWYLIGLFLFIGVLEVISEIVKIFSLSFRLFGNIYAGEVVLSTISSIFAFLAPIPFLMLESIVAVVQALVFSMLTMAFMTAMTESHGEEH